jgi:hypothetical protein
MQAPVTIPPQPVRAFMQRAYLNGGDGYLADRSICMPEIVRAMPVADGVYLDNVKWQQILKTRGILRGTCRGDSHLAL